MNNNDFFLKQMKGVSPIKKNNRIKKEEKKTKQIDLKKITPNQNIAPTPKQNKIFKNSDFNLENVDLKKNIRKGYFKIDKKIDFHGRTLLESEEIFTNAVTGCYNTDQRCLLFVTGKGLFKSKNTEKKNQPKLYYGVIRSALFQWVKSNKLSRYILSFEQASIEHGGDGAFYVYLRKKKN